MLYTLSTLEQFKYDFLVYATAVIRCITSIPYSCKDLVQGLAYGLYILTYDSIGQPSKEQLDDERWIIKARKRTKAIIDTLSDSDNFRKRVDTFYKRGRQYGIKRVWCCLRDYIKSPEFGERYFRRGLLSRGIEAEIVNMLFSYEAKCYLELPGDVWNNNSTFRNCLLADEESLLKKIDAFNKLLRQLFERENIAVGYLNNSTPLSISYRMCEKAIAEFARLKPYVKETTFTHYVWTTRISFDCSCLRWIYLPM